MIFDQWDKGFEGLSYETYQERTPAPDGRHVCEIKRVKPWKNRNGVIVECEVVGANYEPVAIFCDGDQLTGYENAMRILRAVGHDPSTPIDQYLQGLLLELVTKQSPDKNNPGRMKANVNAIHPVTAAEPAAKQIGRAHV